MHLILIGVHAVAASAGLVFGFLAWRRERWSGAMAITVVIAMASLAAGVGVGWSHLSLVRRITYLGLVLLGAATVVAADVARRRAREYRHHAALRFVLVSLVDALVVVGAQDVGAPVPASIGLALVSTFVVLRLLARVPPRRTSTAEALVSSAD